MDIILMLATKTWASEVGSQKSLIASIFAPGLSDERTVNVLKPAIKSVAYVILYAS